MAQANVVVDTKALEQMAADMLEAKYALLARLGERGGQLLRIEAPERSGNLKKGVGAPEYDFPNMTATITVSASRDATGPQSGTIYNQAGVAKKEVTLKPQPGFNYAKTVVDGRRAFMAKGGRIAKAGHEVIGPGFAHMLTIPVSTKPSTGSYLIVAGQIYIFRPSAKAVDPNPFDQRAATRLENEAPAIAEAVLRKFV